MPRGNGVNLGLQSAIPKHSSVRSRYAFCASEIDPVMGSWDIFMPRIIDRVPRSLISKHQLSSALASVAPSSVVETPKTSSVCVLVRVYSLLIRSERTHESALDW